MDSKMIRFVRIDQQVDYRVGPLTFPSFAAAARALAFSERHGLDLLDEHFFQRLVRPEILR